MNEDIKSWLYRNSTDLSYQVIDEVPNILPDVKDIEEFVHLAANGLSRSVADQLYSVQLWAVRILGGDTTPVKDWLLIFRVLKDKILKGMAQEFGAEKTIEEWALIDRLFSYALIETAKLGGSKDNAILLDHMITLRRQMADLERHKSYFIQVAAHELRTPLTLLEGYTNMIRDSVPKDDMLIQMYVNGLDGGTYRLREIIGDMVDLNFIESGAVHFSRQPVSLDQAILKVVSTLQSAYDQRKVNLVIEPFDDIPCMVHGDPDRLVQVFSKILGNALKFTPDGGTVTVRAKLVAVDENGTAGFIDIQTQDTGIGIDPANLERIFQSFGAISDVALHSSGKTKFRGGGPGLGLPIARGIVEAHGGRVWAESVGFDEKARHGSTFHVELPLWSEEMAPPADTPDEAPIA